MPSVEQQVELLLHFLRSNHCYCYYCGCQYGSAEELEGSCPGQAEEDH